MVATATTTPLPALSRADKLRLTLYFSLGQSVEALALELHDIHRDHQSRLQSSNPTPATFHEALTTENTALSHSGLGTRDSALSPSPHSALGTQHSVLPPPDAYDLATWTLHASIAPHIAYRRAEHLEHRKQRALAELDAILSNSDSPIEKRRAATTMLRMLSTQLYRSRTSDASPPPSSPPGGGPALRGGGGSVSTSSTHAPSSSRAPSSPPANEADTPPSPAAGGRGARAAGGEGSVPTSATHSPSRDTAPTTPVTAKCDASSPHPVTAPISNSPPSIPTLYSTGEIQTPPNSPLPDPTRSPEDLIQLTLAAIQNPDSPSPDAARTILYNLHGNYKRRSLSDLNNFNKHCLNSINPAWRFRSAAGAAPLKPTPAGLTTRIPITLANNTIRNLDVGLKRPTAGPLKDCWLLDYILLLLPRPNTS